MFAAATRPLLVLTPAVQPSQQRHAWVAAVHRSAHAAHCPTGPAWTQQNPPTKSLANPVAYCTSNARQAQPPGNLAPHPPMPNMPPMKLDA